MNFVVLAAVRRRKMILKIVLRNGDSVSLDNQ